MYKCAIIGVGQNRSCGLAAAYRHIKKGELAAVSARTTDRLDTFAAEYGVASKYTDYRDMLEKEKPDLLHVNTPPTVRLEIFEAAEAAGVAAIIVEKPLAVEGEDFRQIETFSRSCHVKIAINHQLHFQPRRFELQERVAHGEIGDVRLVEASCGMNLAYQGTHALQAIGAFHPARPVSVIGQVSGAQGLADNPKKHFAPQSAQAVIVSKTASRLSCKAGRRPPRLAGRQSAHTSESPSMARGDTCIGRCGGGNWGLTGG